MKYQLLVLIEVWFTRKKFRINFSKVKTNFCLYLHYNDDNSYLFVNGREIYKFKGSNKMIIFHLNSGSCVKYTLSNKFDYVDSEEISLKRNVHNFSVDYDAIDKSKILNIHKYLMNKNDI